MLPLKPPTSRIQSNKRSHRPHQLPNDGTARPDTQLLFPRTAHGRQQLEAKRYSTLTTSSCRAFTSNGFTLSQVRKCPLVVANGIPLLAQRTVMRQYDHAIDRRQTQIHTSCHPVVLITHVSVLSHWDDILPCPSPRCTHRLGMSQHRSIDSGEKEDSCMRSDRCVHTVERHGRSERAVSIPPL